MRNKKAAAKKNAIPTTQMHLPIAEFKQDTIIMKDGTLRAVLMVSSINFALKNEDEQNAVVSAYVSFLNGLEHPLEILMQSRKLHIQPYLDDLVKKEHEQTNELLRIQIADYRSFVSELVDMGEIMSKNFYAIVPYDPATNKQKSFWTRVGEIFNPANFFRLKEEKFKRRKYDLDMRVRQVAAGLGSMGLTVVRLDTQSLIELMYSTYNVDISLTEPIGDLGSREIEIA